MQAHLLVASALGVVLAIGKVHPLGLILCLIGLFVGTVLTATGFLDGVAGFVVDVVAIEAAYGFFLLLPALPDTWRAMAAQRAEKRAQKVSRRRRV